MPLQDDWMKRMISQLARTLARAMGFRAKGEFDQALEATRSNAAELVGLPREVLDSVAPSGAAMMLRDSKKIDAYAQLLEADAETYQAMGRSSDAEAMRSRANELRRSLNRP